LGGSAAADARRPWAGGLACRDQRLLHRKQRRSKPLPGVVQTVAALAARGIPQVCVSNSNRPLTRANLAALGLSSYLAFAISLDDVSNGKPDPEPYLRVVERLQLQPNEVQSPLVCPSRFARICQLNDRTSSRASSTSPRFLAGLDCGGRGASPLCTRCCKGRQRERETAQPADGPRRRCHGVGSLLAH